MKFTLPALSFCLAAAMTATAAPSGDEAFQLIVKLRATALKAEAHAAELRSVAETPTVSWETNAYNLRMLKDDINSMGPTFQALEKMGDSLTPAEREEIVRTKPLVAQMATDTASAIRFVSTLEGETWRPSYQKYAADLETLSIRVSKSLGEYVQVVKLREKEQRVETDLGGGGF